MTKYFKSCSVFGHKKIDITEDTINKLESIFKHLITQKNVRCFYFGGFSEFDELCWKIVTRLKKDYEDIKRIFCLSDPRHQRLSKRPIWLKNEDYEKITYLYINFDYWYTRIYYRNCEIINRSDFVIFYVNHFNNSGAYKAMQYAKLKKKNIINVCDN